MTTLVSLTARARTQRLHKLAPHEPPAELRMLMSTLWVADSPLTEGCLVWAKFGHDGDPALVAGCVCLTSDLC